MTWDFDTIYIIILMGAHVIYGILSIKNKEYSNVPYYILTFLILGLFEFPLPISSQIMKALVLMIGSIYLILLLFSKLELVHTFVSYIACISISLFLFNRDFNIYMLLAFQVLILLSFLISARRSPEISKKHKNKFFGIISVLAIILQLSIITMMFGSYYCENNECTICLDVSQFRDGWEQKGHYFMEGLKAYFYNEWSFMFLIQKLTGVFFSMVVVTQITETIRKVLFSSKDNTDM